MAQPPILSWENLGLQQGGRWLFGGPNQHNIDLHIGPRDRLALIGGQLLKEGLGLSLYGWYLLCILFQLSFPLGEGKTIRWESKIHLDDNS